MVVPFALLLPLIARDLSNVIWGYASRRATFSNYTLSLALFGPGLVLFTVHYLMLRGFYAVERTRTVFFIQCGVAATNIVVAIALVGRSDPAHTSPALVLAYTASYLVGAVVSYAVLRNTLGGLETPQLVRFLSRMLLAAAGSTAVAFLLAHVVHRLGQHPNQLVAAGQALVITLVDLVVFVLLARILRLREVTSVIDMVASRLPSARRG